MTDITDTRASDNALADWLVLASQLTEADNQAAAALESSGAALGTLYDGAEAAGDEAAMSQIISVWQAAQTKRQIVQQMDAAVTSAAAVMRDLVRQRHTVLKEYNSLVQAIESADTLDPRLSGLVAAVEEETLIYAEEAAFDGAIEQANEVVYDELFESFRANVAETTNIHWTELRQFMLWITGGRRDLNSVQIGLFKAFIAALNVVDEPEAAHV